ncbi:M28 family metallopeptidase [Arenicella xantha]|uniref:Zn-dependent M28 family amino/carboxypeptidase n=1 Tax=Arenicella xantha TaxID=644221 RepID=A0A395JKV7_9GAMM|nr:M28 family metallopeptidase [Arenicella xantha]RBP49682.1 Zn-dependent M28 family amino/carboxypeptidase [Arenicella xantha]
MPTISKSRFGSHIQSTTMFSMLIAAFSLTLTACDQPQQTKLEAGATNTDQAAQSMPVIDAASIETAASQIDDAGFMQHVRTLASDEFEGRAPSTPGGEKTVSYLENEFNKLGLKPAFGGDGDTSYRQGVELMELTITNNPALTLTHKDGTSQVLPYKESSVSFTSRTGDAAQLEASELVFVGYGVVAPEYGWNDYAGIDMTGKTAVILVNDPGYRAENDELFKGRAMTYYGRWTYKYEEAARQGAAGAIIVHEDGAAGYPWEVVSGSWSGPQYNLYTADGNQNNLAVEAWMTQDAAQSLFASNKLDYTEMVAKATQPGFTPISMSSTASASLEITSRQSKSYNVGALIEGSTRPDELFIYTAHWDHLGVKSVADGEDAIFNGAQDNATGTAALIELAQAFKALPTAPERSVMFLAVTAEESGLLGSKYYAENPAFPMHKTIAGINVDGMSTIGATDDIVVVGYGNSQMDEYLRHEAEKQNRVLVPEPTPEKGYFYRSDHFNLAKKGVPMLYAEAGLKVRGKPAGYGQQESDKYLAERYHKAADEIHPEWDNGGILQDLNAHFRIGVAISNSNDQPQWSEGNEFKAIREASLIQ